jgi:hypothetical protein
MPWGGVRDAIQGTSESLGYVEIYPVENGIFIKGTFVIQAA